MKLQNESHLLEINNLSTSFRSEKVWIEAIKNVSFSLEKGRVLGIVGESGSGKSVTSLSVMGLLPEGIGKISGGKIRFENKDINSLSEEEFKNIRGNDIAMVFQEPMTSLNPVMKCGPQVAEVILEHTKISKKDAKTKVIQLFEKVKLPNPEQMFDRYPHQISGGQKQRVVIALALICQPKLLIADEPTTALDATVQKEILALLKELQTELDLGMIFISHDLDVVREIADEILVMLNGEIVEYGNAEKLLTNPEHPYTRGLINCKPPIDKRPIRLPVVSDFLNNEKVEIIYEIQSERDTRLDNIYSKDPILKVKKLSKFYSDEPSMFSRKKPIEFKAVDNVSFELFEGETLGLVGESGCGKTTLSRALLKLIEPTSGEIWYKNKRIDNLKSSELRLMRKELQIIFQDPYSSLNPRKTVGSSITEPMKIFGIGNSYIERKEKAIFLLEKTGLNADHFERYPHEFSGGQRQRVVIARTLGLSPSFVVCDESVSALDVSVQAQVLNLLNDLKKEFNLTYLFISHDMSVVKYMSDRIMVMNQGKIEEIEDSDQLFSDPKSPYTKNLLESIPK